MLREFTDDDSGALYKVYGDAEATRHLSFEPKDMEQVSAVVAAAVTSASADPRTEYMLVIADLQSGELVGAARLVLGDYSSGQIGFALRPDQWGQRKGTETVRLLEHLAGYGGSWAWSCLRLPWSLVRCGTGLSGSRWLACASVTRAG